MAMANLKDYLKEDVYLLFRHYEKRFPENPDLQELGLTYLLFDLECKLNEITRFINHKYLQNAENSSDHPNG